jgi:hypothetical protein
MIERVCCVCGKHMGTKDGEGKSGVSHGYCEECKKAVLAQIAKS